MDFTFSESGANESENASLDRASLKGIFNKAYAAFLIDGFGSVLESIRLLVLENKYSWGIIKALIAQDGLIIRVSFLDKGIFNVN